MSNVIKPNKDQLYSYDEIEELTDLRFLIFVLASVFDDFESLKKAAEFYRLKSIGSKFQATLINGAFCSRRLFVYLSKNIASEMILRDPNLERTSGLSGSEWARILKILTSAKKGPAILTPIGPPRRVNSRGFAGLYKISHPVIINDFSVAHPDYDIASEGEYELECYKFELKRMQNKEYRKDRSKKKSVERQGNVKNTGETSKDNGRTRNISNSKYTNKHKGLKSGSTTPSDSLSDLDSFSLNKDKTPLILEILRNFRSKLYLKNTRNSPEENVKVICNQLLKICPSLEDDSISRDAVIKFFSGLQKAILQIVDERFYGQIGESFKGEYTAIVENYFFKNSESKFCMHKAKLICDRTSQKLGGIIFNSEVVEQLGSLVFMKNRFTNYSLVDHQVGIGPNLKEIVKVLSDFELKLEEIKRLETDRQFLRDYLLSCSHITMLSDGKYFELKDDPTLYRGKHFNLLERKRNWYILKKIGRGYGYKVVDVPIEESCAQDILNDFDQPLEHWVAKLNIPAGKVPKDVY